MNLVMAEYKPLSEMFELINGMTNVSNKWANEGNCKFIDYLNVYTHKYVDTSDLQIATVKSNNQTELQKGDILLTSASEIPEECAISSVIRDDIAPHVFLDDHLFGLRLKNEYKNVINTQFINYYFSTPFFYSSLRKVIRGATRFYVTKTNFLKIKVPIPSLEVQNEIVHNMDNFTELIETLNIELRKQEKMFKYFLDKTIDDLNLSNYPKYTINDISKHQNKKNKEHVTERAYSITKKGLVSTKEYFGEKTNITSSDTSGYYIVNKGWFVYSPSRIDVGSINYLKEEGPVIVSPLDVVFSVNTNIILEQYLYYFLKSSFGLLQILRHRQGIDGTGRKTLPFSEFSKIKVAVPSMEIQKELVDKLKSIEMLCETITDEIEARQKQYEYYRDKLLDFKKAE